MSKSHDLCIPKGALTQHVAVLGKTGSGKSSVLRHMVEYLLGQGKRVCIVDPKGDWYGLKLSADGKSAGFPVILFGDFKADDAKRIPINQHSGKQVAELVASGNRPCVIGFRGWMTGAMTRFWIDFASTLFNQNSGELFLVGDEFHNFAPKGKIMSPEAGMSLHWANRIMTEGRGVGMVCMIASQRPQKVHNDTLTACETLVAMRVVHAADRAAVKDWIDGCGDPKQGTEVLNALAGMARGEAYVWSPEIGFGPQRIKFPMFSTFDSFAPPQLQKKIASTGWEGVDLDDVQKRFAAEIEKAKAEDPKLLQKRIRELEAELKKQPAAAPAPAPKIKEIHVLKDGQIAKLDSVVGKFADALGKLQELSKSIGDVAGEIVEAIKQTVHNPRENIPNNIPRQVAVRKPVSELSTGIVHRNTRISPPDGSVPLVGKSGLRRMLVALAQRPGLSRGQLGIRATVSSKGGSFDTYLSRARTNGWIEDRHGKFFITDAGLEALGDYEPLPSGSALAEHYIREFGNSGAARMLRILIDNRDRDLSREELGEMAGVSAAGGSFDTYLSRLRSLELVDGLRASDELFD